MQHPTNTTTSRSLSLILAGIMIGGTLIGPVSAAVSLDRDDRRFVRKTARKIANTRTKKVSKQLQPQIDANAAGVATKQTACTPGAALAFVHVDVSETQDAYSSDGTAARFNCKDPADVNTVLVKKQGTGLYRISLPGITDAVPTTVRWVAFASIGANTGAHGGVTVFPLTDTAIGETIVDVYIESDAGSAADFDFQVALFGYAGQPGTAGMPERAPEGANRADRG